jgi:Holliday junction resolvase RusA-like endonuclease
VTFQVIFSVYGDPVAKGRPKFTRQGRAYTPAKTRAYEEEVAMMARSAMGASEPLETPIEAFIYINCPVPPSYSKKRTEACLNGLEYPRKFDIDNVAKAILDACNEIIYLDDTQVVSLHVKKRYDTIASVHCLFKESLS